MVLKDFFPVRQLVDLPIEYLCIMFTALAILTTFLYFSLSDYRERCERKDRVFYRHKLKTKRGVEEETENTVFLHQVMIIPFPIILRL